MSSNYNMFDGKLFPLEAEARLGVLKCPKCDSRTVAVNREKRPDKVEYGCTNCGAYSTDDPGNKACNRIDMGAAIKVAFQGTRQQPSDVEKTTEEKLRQKVKQQ